MNLRIILYLICCSAVLQAQPIVPVRIHYDGGGDWYGNKTTWVNILDKAEQALKINVAKREVEHRLTDIEFRHHPIAYIAGHGNISFSDEEVRLLRNYLTQGGFLWADDDYGMDDAFRREMKKVFPELKFVELPYSHGIYDVYYRFDNGLPKVHEHDGGPPAGLGLIYEGRLVCFYSYNTDISDGCENADIHNDPPEVRKQALRMGVNILVYAVLN